MIDITVPHNEISVAEIIETKVSLITVCSILLFKLSSILPIKMAIKPNKIVKTSEKTVVNVFANSLSTDFPIANTIMTASAIGMIIKQHMSHMEILSLRAFLKTLNCSVITSINRTFLLKVKIYQLFVDFL